MIGESFSCLTVASTHKTPDGRFTKCVCKCTCGEVVEVSEGKLRKGAVKSCGHLKGIKAKDRVGTITPSGVLIGGINKTLTKGAWKTYFNLVCVCGAFFCVPSDRVVNRNSTCISCGVKRSTQSKLKGNSYTVSGGCAIVDVSTESHPNATTTIDSSDLHLINGIRWYARSDKDLVYVVRVVGRKLQRLHRCISKPTKHEHVDHINGDTLDNRKSNLRNVDRSENQRNMSKSRANKSGVTGVFWSNRDKRWVATISTTRLGSFINFDDAVAARKEAEVAHGFHSNHGRDKPL